VKFDDGGNYHEVNEDYLAILVNGPLLLDFQPVFQAAEKVVPSDMETYQPTSQLDFELLLFSIQTVRRNVNVSPKLACCEGRVEAPFRIEPGRVVTGEPKFFPN
jgi:hypothetical protein